MGESQAEICIMILTGNTVYNDMYDILYALYTMHTFTSTAEICIMLLTVKHTVYTIEVHTQHYFMQC
jgi:hypothetical protein